MKSNFVLGHELMHGWSFENTNASRSDGARLSREKVAVTFENYLRASTREKVMRTIYTLDGSQNNVFALENTSVQRFKRYKLPSANYLTELRGDLPLPMQADNTINREGRQPKLIDTRRGKL
jgi:hypothetical protein